MASLFYRRPARRRRLFVGAATAIIIEGSLVGLAALWPTSKDVVCRCDPFETQVEASPAIGDAVQELIAPTGEPVPTPETMPTPPPEDTPVATDTPPTSYDPQMEPPTPFTRTSVKPATRAIPKEARSTDHPQDGVIRGGLTHASRTSGVPGFARLGVEARWNHPKPPYPASARLARIEGNGAIRVTTDAAGHVVSAVLVQSTGNSLLDANTVSFAETNWSGPPNASLVIPITYRLQ